jgi:Family of unknown function (DUF5908)
MPVEIKELVIKAVVNENGNNGGAASATSSGQEGGSQDAMIKLCVEKVLEILKDQKER